jgi:VanZ family protein
MPPLEFNFSESSLRKRIFIYGFLIEVYQIFLPHRGFEIRDLGWNGFGILAASGFLWVFKRQRLKLTITNRKF